MRQIFELPGKSSYNKKKYAYRQEIKQSQCKERKDIE